MDTYYCWPCPSGGYSAAASMTCSFCTPGTYYSYDANRCLSCNQSQFNNASSMTMCYTCPDGTYAAAASSTCRECGGTGTYFSNDANDCVV